MLPIGGVDASAVARAKAELRQDLCRAVVRPIVPVEQRPGGVRLRGQTVELGREVSLAIVG
jgi:hypothetical protein